MYVCMQEGEEQPGSDWTPTRYGWTRGTDDDDTLERHTDTNKLTGHTASWAATHPEWAYTSLKATFPLSPPQH